MSEAKIGPAMGVRSGPKPVSSPRRWFWRGWRPRPAPVGVLRAFRRVIGMEAALGARGGKGQGKRGRHDGRVSRLRFAGGVQRTIAALGLIRRDKWGIDRALQFVRRAGPRRNQRPGTHMKVRNSLKLRGRHRDNQIVRRKGRVYIINKTQKRFKARQG